MRKVRVVLRKPLGQVGSFVGIITDRNRQYITLTMDEGYGTTSYMITVAVDTILEIQDV